jgi:tetratricopeptide (TPR) repeat protein
MMKTGKIALHGCLFFTFLTVVTGCTENFLDVLPEDQITSAIFWQDEKDVILALNGIYSGLKDRYVYGYGPQLDACSSDGYQWAYWEGQHQFIGNGNITSSNWFVEGRWTGCYQIISRANYFLDNIDKAALSDEVKAVYVGEAHFLRGVAYSILADTYGGVPLFTSVPTIEEARKVRRASEEETWEQAGNDFDIAAENLDVDAPQIGRATKGAALGMKMRTSLYQGDWDEVIECADQIIELGKYSLLPQYEKIFMLENENNQEVIFDIQFMDGPYSQHGLYDGSFAKHELGNIVAPLQNLISAFETLDGSPVDPGNPYINRDPRLNFSIVLPGTYIAGELYPTEVRNATGQRVGFCRRKYMVDDNSKVSEWACVINYIVLRYADVLLSKAEALIESNQNIDEAITLINRIRNERSDVKMPSLPLALSQEEARSKLRHERRIEFACEGLYWSDIRRWNIGPEIYPVEVRAADGSLIEIKFPAGYSQKYNLLPIPDSERSLNPNLEQNPGY